MPRSNDRPAKISFRNITKEFVSKARGTSTKALNGLSLDIAEKDFVCLIGPSGCGKSTLLNLIGGFEHATSGDVLLDGVRVTAPGPDRGVVFQEGALFPWLNVLDNVCFGPRRLGLPRERYLEEAHAILEEVGLLPFARHLPAELSGGMRQRVAIARALINHPPVLLMDEPFAALDPQTRVLMQEMLLRIWEHDNRTVLFITHDVEEALFLGTRVVVMSSRPGRILKDVRAELPRPRDFSVFGHPEFVKVKAELFALVREQTIAAAADASGNAGTVRTP
ncbi:MAG: ABC transporter ATP-binding protein [Proteobacteria bacterium]|nr:ABC transporter ATP-binding protein [Pseudomonadota bacterium]